jgi:hypothetical protein
VRFRISPVAYIHIYFWVGCHVGGDGSDIGYAFFSFLFLSFFVFFKEIFDETLR